MEKNKPVDLIRKYVRLSVFNFVAVTLLVLSLVMLVLNRENRVVFILSAISAVLFYIICNFFIVRNFDRIIFYDQFTLFRNEPYIMKTASMLLKQKKLGMYNGLLINLKNFKYVNQRYGIDNGDSVIRLYAELLDKYARQFKGYAGRIGGDNYHALIPKENQRDFINMLQQMYLPVRVDDEIIKIPVRCRVGIYELTNETPIRTLVFHGIIAVGYGRSVYEDIIVFNSKMLEHFENEKKIINEAKYALKRHEFIPFYQPKVDLRTGELCGCEALARWDKKGTMISPAQFIPAMEKEGLITDLDFTILEIVCMDIRNWKSIGLEPVRVSTNFSKLHLKDPDFVKKIIEIKNKYEIDGKYLEVELTESAGLSDFELIKRCIDQLRAEGIHVSIDDFGTGYSSLSMIQTIQADVIKMDKSFLDNSYNIESRQFIVDVINIVKHQNETVLFEGVESKEQVSFLKENNCDIIQGYYFDKPLTHSEFENRLRNPVYNKLFG